MIDTYKIGRLMTQNGLTQDDLAKKVGISRRTMNTYLKSGEVKKEKILQPMADVLGVDVAALTAGREPTKIVESFNREIRIKGNANRHVTQGDLSPETPDYKLLIDQIEAMKRTLEAKDEALQAKDELIEILKKVKNINQ